MDLFYLISQSSICESICFTLSAEERISLRNILGYDELKCILPISDRNHRIKFLYPINGTTISVYYYLKNHGFSSNRAIHDSLGGDFEMTQSLLDFGANINAENSNNWTLLNRAIINGRLKTVQKLLDQGADLTDGFLVATEFGRLLIIQELLKRGVDINMVNEYNENALFYAILDHRNAVAKFLIDEGIDLSLRNVVEQTALDVAKTHCALEIEQMILTKLS